ncbi:MAG: ATP-binding cassette domain-containing protein [Pirellulaceae bacterium]|nr:ATP-binding cassette domain-containing protein [Planctomycetales bacterium]
MIQLDRMCVKQGRFQLENISLQVPSGNYATLMGKTGAGKTTIIESICGLRPISSGQIVVGDRDVTRVPPAQRGIGYVPQDGALFPSMTVAQHLKFPLHVRRWTAKAQDDRVRELAALLHIEPLMERLPRGLSGGEVQRVALGRALSFHPAVVLLDEPLSAVDDETRQQMYDLIARVRTHTRATFLHITHNTDEATELGDLHFLLNNGQIINRSTSPEAVVK